MHLLSLQSDAKDKEIEKLRAELAGSSQAHVAGQFAQRVLLLHL